MLSRSTDDSIVHVELKVINRDESHPNRVLTLDTANNFTIQIGRGSRSGGKELYPAADNAWFDSRVMSREHAILRAHPNRKASRTRMEGDITANRVQMITIEDRGSVSTLFLEDAHQALPQHLLLVRPLLSTYRGDNVSYHH